MVRLSIAQLNRSDFTSLKSFYKLVNQRFRAHELVFNIGAQGQPKINNNETLGHSGDHVSAQANKKKKTSPMMKVDLVDHHLNSFDFKLHILLCEFSSWIFRLLTCKIILKWAPKTQFSSYYSDLDTSMLILTERLIHWL